jgi:glucuronate isomerase
MDKQARIAVLQAEIDSLQQKKEQVEQWEESVCLLDSFTPDEKIKVFDELYQQAWEYLQSFAETGCRPKDGAHYLYEAVLSKMLGNNVWSIIRYIQA